MTILLLTLGVSCHDNQLTTPTNPAPSQNTGAHRSLKPQILSTIGDVALALGPNFQQYLEVVLQILLQAAAVQSDKVTITTYLVLTYLQSTRVVYFKYTNLKSTL